MRSLNRIKAPKSVLDDLESTSTMSYGDLRSRHGAEIRAALGVNQKGLCAFCCDALSANWEKTRIAHVIPQSADASLVTDIENFALSCDSQMEADPSCDSAQRNRDLPISPYTPHVEAVFDFEFSGAMVGKTSEAAATIRILNLDSADDDRNHRLRKARRDAISAFMAAKPKLSEAAIRSKLSGASHHPIPPFQPALRAVYSRLYPDNA